MGNTQRPLVSVVIPVYNAEQFLHRSVCSVQAQSYAPLEILLVDDGSGDGSFRRMQEMAAGDARIRIFHKENGGASGARNFGVREARGELISFVDSDDWIEPDMIESMVSAWQRRSRNASGAAADPGAVAPEGAEGMGLPAAPGGNGPGGAEEMEFSAASSENGPGAAPMKPLLVQTGRMEEDEEGSRLPDVLPRQTKEELIPPEEHLRRMLLYTGDASFCTKLTPRSLLSTHPFPEGMLGEDFRLHLDMLPESAGVLMIPGTGYHVVHRLGSATRRGEGDGFSGAYIDIIRQADYAEAETAVQYPSLCRAARRFGLYERMDYMLHVPIADMRGTNEFYRETRGYLRAHLADILSVPGLTGKNRCYLLLFAVCPRTARRVHRALRKLCRFRTPPSAARQA